MAASFFASLTWRTVLSHVTVASLAEPLHQVEDMAFVEAASSLAWVTSASNTSTSTLPRDRSCRNTTQEEIREHGGSQRQVGKIFFFLSD
jgi:hypothetical protein